MNSIAEPPKNFIVPECYRWRVPGHLGREKDSVVSALANVCCNCSEGQDFLSVETRRDFSVTVHSTRVCIYGYIYISL